MKRIRLSLASFVLLFSSLKFWWLSSVIANCVIRDQWHFLDAIKLFHEGNLTFSRLVLFDNHTKVGYMLLFLGNAIFFNLNTYVELIISFLFIITISIIIYFELVRSGFNETSFVFVITFIVITVVLMSEAKHWVFRFGLLAVVNPIALFNFLLVGIIADRYRHRSCTSVLILLLLALLTIIMVAGFSGGRSQAFAVAILVSLAIPVIFEPDQRKRILEYISVFILTFLLLQIWYWSTIEKGVPSVKHGLYFILTNLSEAFVYVLHALSSSFFHNDILSKLPVGLKLLPGVSVLSLYIFAIWLFFRLRIYNKTLIPLMLIVYSVGFIGLLLLGRFGQGFGIANAAAPRYVGETIVGWLGVFWIYGLAIAKISHIKLRRSLAILMLASVLSIEAGNIVVTVRDDIKTKSLLQQDVIFLKNREYGKLQRIYMDADTDLKPVIKGDQILRQYKLGPYADSDN